ncbi:MAG: class II fructose-bisphosphate aldolase [Desulfamplus sp.]|nr:class II fructose-bisphosphate aldolase [Desulfamplus sp.]
MAQNLTISNTSNDFKKALELGRPENIKSLFPNSHALIVSGKYIDRAMIKKGKAMTIAANGRNYFIIKGALMAAQRANAAIIIEIARSEGGTSAYCPVSLWNIARHVDSLCNELNITIPVAIHADHFGIKNVDEIEQAKLEITSLFDAGITSIALDASHLPDAQNLLTNIELKPFVPDWAGLETEVGEIKGKSGLSTVEEALFLIQGLNAHNIFPNWIALNNGTTHGIEESGTGINVELTQEVHKALAKYNISGAQHGTSGNSSAKLMEIAQKTRTTKANVATALQMISWGVEVNDYGNAIFDHNKDFIKQPDRGVSEETWKKMLDFAQKHKLKAGDFKKLNLPFENIFLAQPKEIRDRMSKGVEEFIFNMLVNLFNARDTASIAIEDIIKCGSPDPGPKSVRVENPDDWTKEEIIRKGALIQSDKGGEGNFDD